MIVSNKIKFIALSKKHYDIVGKPTPAESMIPSWWKDMSPYTHGNKLIVESGQNNSSPKRCIPVRDAIVSGYTINLWTDVQVRSLSDSIYKPGLFWKSGIPVFEENTDASKMIQTPSGYCPTTFKFVNYWIITTPKGYSISAQSPAGYDNPLKVVPGIVDTDKYPSRLPFPMWIKEGYEGTLEKGTPLVQVLPFKRESWKSEFDFLEDDEFDVIEETTIKSKLSGFYVKNCWTKKEYK